MSEVRRLATRVRIVCAFALVLAWSGVFAQASRALGDHARRIYAEIGKNLVIDALAEGGGTDAAFASLETRAPVLERFGLQGFGAHSNDAEYVAVDSIEPRLYLLARLIMDVSQGKDRR